MPTPIPTRTCLEIAVTAEAGGKRQAASGDPLDELFPRVDIDRLVAGTSILAEIKSDAWKNRKEALETLQSILDVGSNKRLKPSMGS
jgi:cytoskeleton-associated protein 5